MNNMEWKFHSMLHSMFLYSIMEYRNIECNMKVRDSKPYPNLTHTSNPSMEYFILYSIPGFPTTLFNLSIFLISKHAYFIFYLLTNILQIS